MIHQRLFQRLIILVSKRRKYFSVKRVFDDKISVSEGLGLTKALTKLMNPVFKKLGINFQFFLCREISMKAIEHILCIFDKYYRSVLGRILTSRVLVPSFNP